jgi:hypothetical protein
MSDNCDEKEPKRVPFSDIAKGLNQGLESADPMRVTSLTRLARVRSVREAELKREQERLKAKLGANHPRVTAIAAKIDANRELKRDVELGLSRAATPAARPDKNGWILHGHVRDRSRQGMPNLTVGLYNERSQWVEELGYACTDKAGYFRLCPALPQKEPAESGAAGPQVFIHVLDDQGRRLYIDRRPLTPAAGRVNYREIILLGDAEPCRPPEPAPGPPETVVVPSVVGLPESDAAQAISAAGLTVGERKTRTVSDQVGLVLEQDPMAGTRAAPRTPVALVVGVAQQVEVPDVTGQSLDEAVSLMRERNLVVGTVQRRAGGRGDAILEQKPAAGTKVAAGTAIDLVVGGESERSELRPRIAELFTRDPQFEAVGLSERVLLSRFEERGLTARAQFQDLLALPDRELRDAMRLPNLPSAQIFKEILKRVLDELRR